MAVLPDDKYPRICPVLQGLDALLPESLEDNGVVIPMNSIKVCVPRCGQRKSDEVIPQKLPKSMKLRYLEIRFYSLCSVRSCFHRPVEMLLRHNAENLRSLTIEMSAEYLQQVFADCSPNFPSMEEIAISVWSFFGDQDLSAEKKVIEQMLNGVRNLKRIFPIGNTVLGLRRQGSARTVVHKRISKTFVTKFAAAVASNLSQKS